MWDEQDHVWLRAALDAPTVDQFRAIGDVAENAGKRLARTTRLAVALSELTKEVCRVFPGYRPVRVVAFDKSERRNWQVPWHQDRVIAVQEYAPVSGFSNWSKKADLWHCEPPVAVLENMLFTRVFLDRCSAESGAMTFARGSHEEGLVSAQAAAEVASKYPEDAETAQAGDILILPMLTLHRSQSGQSSTTRRVLRVDFAASDLPKPLEWIDYLAAETE